MTPPLVLYGPSGSGKTTWLTAVLPGLRAAGLRVATVKTCHHDAAIEPEGKDSARHLAAGAEEVLLVAPGKTARLRRGGDDLAAAVAALAAEYDLVLVEGGRALPYPKVVFGNDRVGPSSPHPALATAGRPAEGALDWSDPAKAVAGILEWLDLRRRARKVLGVVLAGGDGRRLGGRDKAALVVGGAPLAERAVALLSVHLDAIVFSGPPERLARWGYPVLPDPPGKKGPVAGVLSALDEVAARGLEGALFVAVDQIGATPRAVAAVLSAGLSSVPPCPAFARAGSHPAALAYLPARIGDRPAAACARAAAAGTDRLGEFLRALGARPVPIFPSEAEDLDTPEDLARHAS